MSLEQKRILATAIPGPISTQMQERRKQVIAAGVGTALPVFIDHAHGAIMKDVDGNQLIDMGSGIGVVTIGHTNARVVEAVQNQVAKLTHTLFTVAPYEPYVRVGELITKHAPGNFAKKAAFFTSGAEAVENAVKIARKATGRTEVAVFDHAYHGRTNLTMSMNFKMHPYGTGFGPLAGSVHHAPMSYPFRDAEGMTGEEAATRAINYMEKRIGAKNLAAVVIEPIQGEGGFIVPPKGFLPGLSEYATANGIVFIADEVQTGFARTGNYFAVEDENVEPDMIVTAKGIAGGLPLAAVTARAEIMEQRMKRREFEEEDQRQLKSVSKTKTFKCYYCKNKFYEDGVHDKCMLVKDVNGNRIETGVELLLNIPPAFCSQACYDRFHEYKHDGHDVIF